MTDAGAPQRPIYVNGRFLTAPASGVQRVARALLMGVDAILAAKPSSDVAPWVLLHPEGLDAPPALTAMERRAVAGPPGQLWEQTALASKSRDGVLVNLANTAPLAHPRVVVMFHDAQVYDAPQSYSRLFLAWYRVMQPRVAARAARVLTVSQFSAERLKAHGVLHGQAVGVVPNGVDHILQHPPEAAVLHTHGLSPQRYVFSFASAQPHKNVGVLLDAFSDPALSDVVLALAGTTLPGGAGSLPSNVKLLGRVSDGALRALYENAALLAFPSLTEGFGLPPGEAMMCGCPVVAADAGAVPEVCGDAAVLINPHDVSTWRETIRGVWDDDARRRELSARGRVRADHFTWAHASQRLYEQIAALASR